MGNLNDIKQSKPMDLIYKKDPTTDTIESFWQKEFYVEATKNLFKYNYVLYNQQDKQGFWEREHIRTFYLNELKEDDHNKSFVLKRDKNMKNFNEISSYTYKNNIFKIYDYDFNYNFSIDDINENIIIGFSLFYLN